MGVHFTWAWNFEAYFFIKARNKFPFWNGWGTFLKREIHYYMAIHSRLALIFFRCHCRRAVFWWMIIRYFASMMNPHGEFIATSKSGEMISFIIYFVQVVDQSYLHYAQWSRHGSLGIQGIQILWNGWCLTWIRIHNTSL